MFLVPGPDYFMTRPGYVLGWYPGYNNNSADIADYPIDPLLDDAYPRYHYNEVYETVIGGVFSKRFISHNIGVQNRMHMIQAHAYADIRYKQVFQHDVEGSLEIGVSLSGAHEASITATTTTELTYVLTGLSASADKTDIESGETVTITIAPLGGQDQNNVVFCVHWGIKEFMIGVHECDWTSETTDSSVTTSQEFTGIGTYSVFVRILNKNSQFNTTIPVFVRGVITDLQWFDPMKKVEPRETGTFFDVSLSGSGTGDFDLIYQLGPVPLVSIPISMTNHFVFFILGLSREPQGRHFTFNITHPRSEMFVEAFSYIQNAIDNFVIRDVNMTTNLTYHWNITENSGSNITYTWFWEDNDIDNSTTTLMSHNYTTYGNRTVKVECQNLISNLTLFFISFVYDEIIDIEFLSPELSTKFGELTNIEFQVYQGTGMSLWIDYGDGHISSVALDMDKTGTILYVVGEHNYTSKDSYTVTIFAQNYRGLYNASLVVPIEDPIEGFDYNITQADPGEFIEQSEDLTFLITMTGGINTKLHIDFGDGTVYQGTGLSVNHNYSNWKTEPGYMVNITIWNNVSVETAIVEIPVYKTIDRILGLQIWSDPAKTTEEMQFYMNTTGGTDFNCTWYFNDIENSTAITLFDDYLNQTFPSIQLEAGEYDVEIQCKSRLYISKATTIAYSYTPASDFHFSAHFECPDDGKGEQNGLGGRMDTFPTDCELILKSIAQEGTNISYLYNFGVLVPGSKLEDEDFVEQLEYLTNQSRYLLNEPEEQKKITVSVDAFNAVSNFSKKLDINLQQRVQNVSILSDSPTMVGIPLNFSINVDVLGYQTCFQINFGDEKQKLVIGGQWCGDDATYSEDRYDKDILPSHPGDPHKRTFPYFYPEIRFYDVTLRAKNLVSDITVIEKIQVEDLPCFEPLVTWTSNLGNSYENASVAPYLRCMKYIITQKTVIDCQRTSIKEYSWAVEKVEKTMIGNDTIEIVNKTYDISSTKTVLVLEPRSLDYGIHRVALNVCMANASETCISMYGYFLLGQCDLVPNIFGGTGRAVAYNKTVEIIGDESYDPDNPDEPVEFEWYCKKKNEFWSNETDYTIVEYPNEHMNGTGSGCFGTGIGKLVSTSK